MTINIIHILEVTSVLLVLMLLIQVRKHYKLLSKPKLEKKQRTVSRTTNKRTIQTALDVNHHYKAASQYYGHKLPELEVSISSDQDIASFSNSSFLKNLSRQAATNKDRAHNSVTQKKQKKPNPESQPTHKAILNSYIDDCFASSPAIETEASEALNFLDQQESSPANDEFITVNEPTEMV